MIVHQINFGEWWCTGAKGRSSLFYSYDIFRIVCVRLYVHKCACVCVCVALAYVWLLSFAVQSQLWIEFRKTCVCVRVCVCTVCKCISFSYCVECQKLILHGVVFQQFLKFCLHHFSFSFSSKWYVRHQKQILNMS